MEFEKNLYAFLRELQRFEFKLSVTDKIWKIVFPGDSEKWHFIHITRYQDTYYIYHLDGNNCPLEIIPEKSIKPSQSFGGRFEEEGRRDPASVWNPVMGSARKWLASVGQNWMRANRMVWENYPLKRRTGIVPHALIRNSLPDCWRLDLEVGKSKSMQFIKLVEAGYFAKQENFLLPALTANEYFEFCRVAYIAGRRKGEKVDKALTGREMYQKFADGRHEGLLDIPPDSPGDFAAWMDGKHPQRRSGGHPWEIKRGGNTTHIDLLVFRPPYQGDKGFLVELRAEAITRLAEAIKMFLALHKASMPVSISDPEGIRLRLLAQDNIGIVPEHASLHRANQNFTKDQHVYDVIHYQDLGRYKRRINPFITWEPLPILKPR